MAAAIFVARAMLPENVLHPEIAPASP